MYERPQFLTPGGFQRSSRSPSLSSAKKPADNFIEQKRSLAILRAQTQSGRGISPEAAKLIAAAISGMLKDRPGRSRL